MICIQTRQTEKADKQESMLSFTWERQDVHKPLIPLQKPPNGQTTKQTNKKAGTRNQTCIQKAWKSNTYMVPMDRSP